MSDTKLTAEESCGQVLKSIADACDQESLARAGGYLFRYVQEETVLRDCGQRGVCRTPPGCARHWEERNRELVRENEVLRSNSDHLSSENASLVSQVESMAMRIESLAEELAKPEDVRLREVLDALEGRAVIFDGLGARVGHLLNEMDEWIGRAGEAERAVEAAQRRLVCVADDMTEHAYQELASALEAPPRVREAEARVRQLEANNEALQSHVAMRTEILAMAERADTIPRAVLVGSLRKRLRQATAPGGASCSSDMRRDAIAETLRGLIREIERGEWPGEGER